jgi:predicted alpha/beta superfamily hydrolase
MVFHADYGRFLVETLKPLIDAKYRTLTEPTATAVMGSSLGGVVSFYLGWQRPEVFGKLGCLSSTFTYRDDLLKRVSTQPDSISIPFGKLPAFGERLQPGSLILLSQVKKKL